MTLADLTGHSVATTLLKQSLGEEEAMASWINDHLAETTRMFVSRSEAGQTAGRWAAGLDTSQKEAREWKNFGRCLLNS